MAEKKKHHKKTAEKHQSERPSITAAAAWDNLAASIYGGRLCLSSHFDERSFKYKPPKFLSLKTTFVMPEISV